MTDKVNQEIEKISEERVGRVHNPMSAQATLWIGIISSIITVVLTIWNGYTKAEIDRREAELKAKALLVEESKERITRYGWVKTLFPELTGTDEKQQILTVNLIRLALTKEEAEQLFSGFKGSANKELQSAGQKGIESIETEEITKLVTSIDSGSTEIRKSSLAILESKYKSSSSAISLVLSLFNENTIEKLSVNGRINALHFLTNTDETAWTQQHIIEAQNVIARLERRDAEGIAPMGDQTKTLFNEFKDRMAKTKSQ